MQTQKRIIGVSVFVACVGVGLIVSSLATNHWISSTPGFRNETNKSQSANISFGLFAGYKSINFGLGDRPHTLESGKSMEWFGLFSFPVYVATLVMLNLAVVCGFLSVGFGFFNVFGRPIETITGPSGLYVWNGLSFVFATAAFGTYLGLYFSQLKVNILKPEELSSFTSGDHTNLDYSFYFVVGAAASFILNLVLLSLSGQKCSCHYSLTGKKEVDSGMILY
ncbi:unnamed protein product [Candidula unifasciata]|uniref:Clarin-3 n=1 Tax=Candidula unifasciata TaxID=100452 RepID=A0A8S4AC85_9EUPU|nr:unnamed protein product [Candidula unifasciata]